MKKRILSVGLVLCLAFSLSVPAYAADNSVDSKMKKDLAAMSSAYIDVDSVSVHSVENGTITYAYLVSDEYTDYITVQHNSDGSSVLNIQENDLQNTIKVLSDGSLILDGEKLTPPEVQSTLPPVISPFAAFSYSYSENPFPGTTSSQYNVGTYYQNCVDIGLAQDIRKVTAAAVGTLLSTAFFPGNIPARKASVKICKLIGSQIKSKAETIAESINAVSYKMKIDGHPKNDTFKFYKKYTGVYYFGKNYSGKTYNAPPFYELRSTLN